MDENRERIIRVVCANNGVTAEQVRSKTRKRTVVQARQMCSYFLREELGLTYEAICAELNYRDHASPIRDNGLVPFYGETYYTWKKKLETIKGSIGLLMYSSTLEDEIFIFP